MILTMVPLGPLRRSATSLVVRPSSAFSSTRHDDVTGAEAGVVGGGADVGSHDDGVIFAGGDDHADAVIFAALVFSKQCELLGVEEIGVRVEHAQHAGNGALVDRFVDVDGVGVIVLHDVEDAGEIMDGGLIVVGGGGGGADVGAVNGAQDGT